MKILSIVTLILVVGYIGFDLTFKDMRAHEVTVQLDRLIKAQKDVERVNEYQIFATKTADIAGNVILENLEMRKTVSNARETVQRLNTELDATKNALADSVKLLQAQLAENTNLREQLDSLQILINTLMPKIPNADRPVQ